MATQIPNTNIPTATTLAALINLLSTNFAAANTALGERMVAERISVNGYAATGATTTQLKLNYRAPAGSTPWAVMLVRARATSDPGTDIAVSGRINFTASGGNLYVYEPSGLTANTKYDLGFLVIYDG